MSIKKILTVCIAMAIVGGSAFAYSADPVFVSTTSTACICRQCKCDPCMCQDKCKVPVYEPAPCAPVETCNELPEPEPCAPVALPSCDKKEKQEVFCFSRKKIRQKTVGKGKRCFLSSMKKNYEQRVSTRKSNAFDESFSFSLCREVKIEKTI